MIESFLPRLESDKPEKKKKKIVNRQIYARYTFTNKGEIKVHRLESVLRCLSRCLINVFGEKTLEILKIIFYSLTAVSYLVMFCFMCIVFTDSVYERYETAAVNIISIGMISFFFAEGVAKVLEYYRDLLCRLCGKRFACEEIKEPTINEISTDNEYTVTVTRHWKCILRACGYKRRT